MGVSWGVPARKIDDDLGMRRLVTLRREIQVEQLAQRESIGTDPQLAITSHLLIVIRSAQIGASRLIPRACNTTAH